MKRLIPLVVVLLVLTTCNAGEPQKNALSKLSMKFSTKTEQIHRFYGSGDFVSNSEPVDCTEMRVEHSISIIADKLYIDKDTENEEIFKINSSTYAKGKVFADKGTVETYRISCKKLIVDEPSPWVTTITIQKVKDGVRNKTIVSIPSIDSDGVMFQNTILKD